MVFARDPSSGQLTFIESQRNGVGGVAGLGDAREVVLSPDGQHVYVASAGDNALVVFARDVLSGRLSFVQVQRVVASPDSGPLGVAISPDGAYVYAAGVGTNAVAVFARDRTTGMLTPIEVVPTGVPPVALELQYNPGGVRLSPDGAHVYAVGLTDNAVTAFGRDAATGMLTRLASWQNGVGGVEGLNGAFALALSPDGTSVYVASAAGFSLAVFARNAGSGSLTFVQALVDGRDGVHGLAGTRGVTVSPDGAHVYATGMNDKSIVLFSRDLNTGRLTFVEERRDVVQNWIGMGEVIGAGAISPDGAHLYVASHSYNALLVFSTNEGGMASIVHCPGDCNEDGQVTVDELVTGVNIALGTAPLSACEMFDLDGAGGATVDELVRGVNSALNGCVDPLTPGDHRRALAFGGAQRIYDLHIPPGYDGYTPVPLVVDFHGAWHTPTFQAGASGLRAEADQDGFIVAYPLGVYGNRQNPEAETAYGPSFNAGAACCLGAQIANTDDVGFTRRMVQAIAAEATIDLARVYATGWSNGAFLSHRLACEAADVFAAAAPVAGRIGLVPTSLCQPSRPIALIEFAGLHDPNVPYAGAGNFISAAASFAYWHGVNGCGSGPPDAHVDVGASFCDTYAHCNAGVQVQLCSVNARQNFWGAGHCTYLNPDIAVADAAWKFLSQFRLPAP